LQVTEHSVDLAWGALQEASPGSGIEE
jgi:hypothetical protein